MKKANCDLSNITLCAMAVSVLGLLGAAAILAVRAAGKHCSETSDCSAENAEQEAEPETE